MTTEYTLSIIKPDAVKRNISGKINSYLEEAGLKIVGQKMTVLTQTQAENFYGEHKERPFFKSLVEFMTSGPLILQVLKGENAIALNRKIMGATNPENADAGTIRKDLAESIEANCVHGSDSVESAKREVEFFFTAEELVE